MDGLSLSSIKPVYTFVLRLWLENTNHEQWVWRGFLDCVQTGERVYFQSLPGMLDCLYRFIGEAGDTSEY